MVFLINIYIYIYICVCVCVCVRVRVCLCVCVYFDTWNKMSNIFFMIYNNLYLKKEESMLTNGFLLESDPLK